MRSRWLPYRCVASAWSYGGENAEPSHVNGSARLQGEVELMKKLHHENIVQYIDTIRTDEYLYIALE